MKDLTNVQLSRIADELDEWVDRWVSVGDENAYLPATEANEAERALLEALHRAGFEVVERGVG